jgi:glycosyltransferase involved in cell wall biosynthesis
VENLPVPLDRRVWQTARALRAAGWDVDVVCPRGRVRDTEISTVREGVRIHRYALDTASGGRLGYLREYAQAFRRVRRLVRALCDDGPVDAIHVCNPPDVLMIACRLAAGRDVPLIFDHHDLFPELYAARFGRASGPTYWVTRLLERASYRLARVAIVPNDSYRSIALGRGGKAPADVFVVRNAPDLDTFAAVEPDPSLRRGHEHLIAYLGVMGPQDGVDHALRALAELHRRRSDWHAVFMGDGDVLPAMVRLAGQLGIAGHVEFTGMVGDAEIVRVLSTADVCIAPDPKNAFNDRSTMNKVVEYMAIGKPVVAYDLAEARVSADGGGLFTPADDVGAFAENIARLLEDPELRATLGTAGRRRVETELNWRRSEQNLLAAYGRVLNGAG